VNHDLKNAACPKCGGIGLSYCDHPHAFGYKDYDRLRCRKRKTCGASFTAAWYTAWIRERCEHEWVRTPDPSGGSDPSFDCSKCGAERKAK